MKEARLRGENGQIVIRVGEYVNPDVVSGVDGNVILGEVEADVGVVGLFRAYKKITLSTVDLRQFRDELRALDSTLTGEATLTNIDSDFQATFRLDHGRGTLSGVVLEWGRQLRFDDIPTDQTFVREVLQELETIVQALPVRGDPYE